MENAEYRRLIEEITEEIFRKTQASPLGRCSCHTVSFDQCPDRMRWIIECGALAIAPFLSQHLIFHQAYALIFALLVEAFLAAQVGRDGRAGSLLGIMFTLSGVAVLLSTLSQLRDIQLALLMALVLIGTPYYLERGVSQYADVPLAVFTISTIALICLHLEREPDRFGPLVLAGFTAGCAGWTKNEGLLFILATCIVLLLPVFRNPAVTFRRFAAFSLGLLLPLAVISYFKLAIAPPYDLIEDLRYQETIQRITSIDRHAVILKSLARSAWFFGAWAMQPMIPLFAFIALRGAGRRVFRSQGGFAGLLILGIVLAGYYAVYLITPIPLQVHLDSSLNRLLIHLWPSFLLVLGLMARSKSLPGACSDTPREGEQREFNSC